MQMFSKDACLSAPGDYPASESSEHIALLTEDRIESRSR